MSTLARYALPGIILASAVGAFIMCLLVLRYGFVADEEDLDERAGRLMVTRFGHAVAAVCFATAAMLAVVAMSVGPAAMTGPVPASAERDSAVVRLDEDLRRLEERVSRELKALEERVTAAPTARNEETPTTVELAPEAPPRPSRPAPSPPDRPRATRPREQSGSALPAPSPGDRFRARVQGVAIDVERATGGDGRSSFVVRLSDAAGQPLPGAEVSLVGTLAGRASVQAALEPSATPGVYRGSLPAAAEAVRDLRLRVVQRDKRFELALAHGVSW